jgi:8-oxo-dGTP diphosphatase
MTAFPATDPRRLALAERVRVARAIAGVSQQFAADHVDGLARSALSDVERGARELTALEAVDLAAVYDIPLTRLLLEAPGTADEHGEGLLAGLDAADRRDTRTFLDYLRYRRRQRNRRPTDQHPHQPTDDTRSTTMPIAVTDAHLTTDVVLFSRPSGVLHILLIERGGEPFEGRLAFPGGYLDRTGDGREETFLEAAGRELREEAGLGAPPLQQVGVYDTPGRDPRARVISVAFAAFLDTTPVPVAGDDARTATWLPVDDVRDQPGRFAFDHHRILLDALAQLGPAAQ